MKEYWTLGYRTDCSGARHLTVFARCHTRKCASSKIIPKDGFQVLATYLPVRKKK